MKKTLIGMFLVFVALLCTLTQTHAQVFNLYDYSLSKKNSNPVIWNESSFVEATLPFKILPNYSLNFTQVKPSIRFTPNPDIVFDGKVPRSELWQKVFTAQDFIGTSVNEMPINYSLNDDKRSRQFLESLPFLPYFHFQSGNASASFLFWTDGKANMLLKFDF